MDETAGGSLLSQEPEQQEEQTQQAREPEEQAQAQEPQEQQTQQPQQAQTPESYEAFAVPEGTTPIDEPTHAELTELGKEMKLTQAQMQQLVSYGAKKIGDGLEAVRLEIMKQEAMKDEETRKRWRQESESDPEIAAGIDHARRLVANVGDGKFREEFQGFMNETHIGDNPVFIRFCIQAGRLLGEDAFLKSGARIGANGNTLTGIAHSLYPDM